MRVLFPSPLHSYTGGRSQDEGQGASLAELLDFLDVRYPGIRFRVVDEHDRIRRHIRFFVNGEVAKDLAQPLAENDEVMIVAALSGG
ncbi:MAG: MoaD/ThiS family protein [Burkholderiales bacterium]